MKWKEYEGESIMMINGKPWPPLSKEAFGKSDEELIPTSGTLTIPPREVREISVSKRVKMRRMLLKIDDLLVDEIRSMPNGLTHEFFASDEKRDFEEIFKTFEVKVFSKVRDFDSPNGLDRSLTFVHRSVFDLHEWKDIEPAELEDVLIAEAVAEALRFAWSHELSECIFIGDKPAVPPHPEGGFSSNVGVFDEVGASQRKGRSYTRTISHRRR